MPLAPASVTATPVVLAPGSSLRRRSCNTDWATSRSLSRIVNGAILWMTARPRSNSSRARFSEHGINGFLCLSRTNTIVFPPPLTGTGHVFLRKSLLAPVPRGRLHPPHRLHDPQLAFNGGPERLRLEKHLKVCTQGTEPLASRSLLAKAAVSSGD